MSSDLRSPEERRPVIDARGLGKSYRMYEKPIHRLLHRFDKKRADQGFWALRDVNLQVFKGETVGIIGRNGSGKSTLLQIVAGTMTPSEGEIRVEGKVAALLELGSGFNPEFTGVENVYLNAAIHGLTRADTQARMQKILAFADIGEFIEQPVRSYSSGMIVRLAFAVIAHVDADILIVDEALSVGDTFFAQKCMRFLREFQKTGTLLFVSHDSAAVLNLCDRAVMLDRGRVRMQGPAQAVVETYLAQQHADLAGGVTINTERMPVKNDRLKRDSAGQTAGHRDFREDSEFYAKGRIQVFEFDPEKSGAEFGTGRAAIVDVAVLDESRQPLLLIEGGELVVLRITVALREAIDGLIFGFYVKDRLGQRLFGDNTYTAYAQARIDGSAGDTISAHFTFRMPLLPRGPYTVDAAVASGTQAEHVQHHWVHDALEFKALDQTLKHGLVGIPMLGIEVVKQVVA